MKRSILLSSLILSSSLFVSADPGPEPPLKITKISSVNFNADWNGTLGNTYFIQYSSDLISWKYMPVIKSGTGIPLGHGFNSSGAKMFLRLRFTDIPTSDPLLADFDSDGIPNYYEVIDLQSDPLDRDSAGGDSDSDELNDGWELYYFGDLNTADPTAIQSADGLTNKEKNDLGLNPSIDYTAPSASEKSTYTYDLTGRLTVVEAPVTGVAFTVDSEGNILNAQ